MTVPFLQFIEGQQQAHGLIHVCNGCDAPVRIFYHQCKLVFASTLMHRHTPPVPTCGYATPGKPPLQSVLYGIFMWVALAAGASIIRLRLMKRPLKHLKDAFADPQSHKDLKAVYRFRDPAQVRFSRSAVLPHAFGK